MPACLPDMKEKAIEIQCHDFLQKTKQSLGAEPIILIFARLDILLGSLFFA
jgi:hypothetical protein